jgi:hypothetical protein
MQYAATKSPSIGIARGPQIVTEAANIIGGMIEGARGVIIGMIAERRGWNSKTLRVML